jgi:D-alanine-D-alanine ligase
VTRVAVVGGGRSCEHDVSTASAASVRAALAEASYDVVGLGIGRDGVWHCDVGEALEPRPLARPSARLLAGPSAGPAASLAAALGVLAACDVVFPAVHGPTGEDGTLAALLDLAELPYVGAGVRGGALAMDKWATKLVAAELGIGTARGYLTTGVPQVRPLVGPVVVKPVSAGSSHGVALVDDAAALAGAVEAALALDDRVLVEELVVGREIDVAVLRRADGSLVLGPPLEVVTPPGALFDTGRKYDGTADFRLPAGIGRVEGKELEAAASAMFEALGCDGVARVDFFLTPDGPVLNEVNTMPGLTASSQVPRMFAAVGLPYPRLLDELVRGALARRRW